MLCELCGKNEATIHIQEIINSQKKNLNICEKCAESHKTQPFALDGGLNLAQLIYNINSKIKGQPTSKGEKQIVNLPKINCPQCGMDMITFTNKGRLGCSQCFKVFRPILAQAIKNMHKGILHVGKKPSAKKPEKTSESKPHIEIIELQKKLEEYIAGEEYEKAAKARDRIKILKKNKEKANNGQ